MELIKAQTYKKVHWKIVNPKAVDTAIFPFPFLTTKATETIIGVETPNAAYVKPIT